MRVKHWDDFQHFKDRNPIWIKLYRKLLDDKQWHDLDATSSKLLIMLWLLASENHGELPSTADIAFRLRMPEKLVFSSISKLSHWLIQDDISPISSCHQVDALERERETEKRQMPLRADGDVSWIEELKKNPAYQHINFAVEFGKMDAWFSLPKHKGRKRTKAFVLNWINKIESPLAFPTRKERLPL